MTTATKYCPACGQIRPTTEFSRDRSARDGLYGLGKQCDRERSRKNYADNRSARRARRRAYNAAHADELRDYSRNYYTANAEALRANQHAYRVNNQEKIAGKKAVHRAIKHGDLPRPQTQACVLCGAPACDYHHNAGYAPEDRLSVILLCRSCHRQVHARNDISATGSAAGPQVATDSAGEAE